MSMCDNLADVSPVRLEIVEGGERANLWNEYLNRHHYLGYSKPFGCTIRYFIEHASGDDMPHDGVRAGAINDGVVIRLIDGRG